MIRLIEALNYRCLKYIRQPMGDFHVLVGPNASGKTTFLDVVAFLGQMVANGLEAAVKDRTEQFRDLVWNRTGDWFEMAVEADIPEDRKTKFSKSVKAFKSIRYEVRIGIHSETQEFSILEERCWLKTNGDPLPEERTLFPAEPECPETIITKKAKQNWQCILSRGSTGNSRYYVEVRPSGGKGWITPYYLGSRKSALGNLPQDESKFPVSMWLQHLLVGGIRQFSLNSLLIRKASPPGFQKGLRPDGSNLPWVINELEKPENHERYKSWVQHVKTALPDVEYVKTKLRPDDMHRYLVIGYKGGLEVPSWMASDGTLRLLALTIPSYLPDFNGICLIEEPENGIHPLAVETVFQSLSSIWNAQVLLATHSAVILNIAGEEPGNILCFKKTTTGMTDIVSGLDHPGLKNWRQEVSLGILFAGGVLG